MSRYLYALRIQPKIFLEVLQVFVEEPSNSTCKLHQLISDYLLSFHLIVMKFHHEPQEPFISRSHSSSQSCYQENRSAADQPIKNCVSIIGSK